MNNVACWYDLSDKLWLCKHAIYLCQHQHAIIVMQSCEHRILACWHNYVDRNFHAELCEHRFRLPYFGFIKEW